MLLTEFEQRTGYFPSIPEYAMIEAFYMDYPGDKDAFCRAYRENKDGLASRIQTKIHARYLEQMAEEKTEKEKMQARILSLEEALERELEWKPCQFHTVSTGDYQELKQASETRVLSEEEAKALLHRLYGFDRDCIRILSAVPVYEKNRHGKLRVIGEETRLPLYYSTDWNYIRFDCGCLSWEMYNDNLFPC